MRTDDTIVAVSSAPGRSPRALLRVSGPKVADWLQRHVDGGERALEAPRLAVAGRAALAASHPWPSPALPALVCYFSAPGTYTGQDVAELLVVGAPDVLRRLVDAATEAGLRRAEPGEFTFRAFAMGRLTLDQAEGVAATIAAEGGARLAGAAALREGALGRRTTRLVDRLANLLALLEAGIDFVEEEGVITVSIGDALAEVTTLRDELRDLLGRARPFAAREQTPHVALLGEPSVGKSTLFNALIGYDRSVTDAARGTTRDVIVEPLTLAHPMRGEVEILLMDLPGLESPARLLDASAQAAARAAASRADLALCLDDSDRPPAGWVAINPRRLLVRTKADLLDKDPAAGGSTSPRSSAGDRGDWADIVVSAAAGLGLDALRSAITHALFDAPPPKAPSNRRHDDVIDTRRVTPRSTPVHAAGVNAQAAMLLPRHEEAIRSATQALDDAIEMLTDEATGNDAASDRPVLGTELLAAKLHEAMACLGVVTGAMSPDDLLDRVFSRFCIGK